MHGSSTTCNYMAAPDGPLETISYLGQIEWKKYLFRYISQTKNSEPD